jgi:hypothetical protein
MGTSSAIVEKTENGYRGIYCHFDGYPDWNGRILQEHYRDRDKVRRLIDLGDLSGLGERVEPLGEHSYANREEGTTLAYGRDRGEEGCEPRDGVTLKDVTDRIEHEYVYLFDGESWTVDGKLLEDVLRKIDEKKKNDD